MTATSSATAPAGWYPDPSAPSVALRWWDGSTWTDWRSVDGAVEQLPLPPQPAGARTDWTGLVDERVQWPRQAIGYALGMLVVSIIVSGVFTVLVSLVIDVEAVAVAAGLVAQTAGLYWTCRAAQQRWGTDRGFRADFGIRYGKGDWWRGLVGSIVARIAGGAVTVFVVSLMIERFESESTEELVTRDFDWGGIVVFAIVALIVAPVVEELFFRGLLQRALEGAMPVGVALVLQGSVFGLLHGDPTLGMLNLVVIVPITVAGITFGFILHRYKRLGPSIAAHAWFNALAVATMLAVGPS